MATQEPVVLCLSLLGFPPLPQVVQLQLLVE
jgi:hypothetical protein